MLSASKDISTLLSRMSKQAEAIREAIEVLLGQRSAERKETALEITFGQSRILARRTVHQAETAEAMRDYPPKTDKSGRFDRP